MCIAAKEIIDEHFTDNYNRYRNICYKYYRGRYLYEDLLNEAYLKFLEINEEVVLRFHQMGRLHNLGLKVIRKIYQDRYTNANRKSIKHEGSNASSPLFECHGCQFHGVSQQDQEELDVELYFEKAQQAISDVLKDPVQSVSKSKWLQVKTFLAAQESNINQLSKDTGISRPFITQTYREGQRYLKEQILKSA